MNTQEHLEEIVHQSKKLTKRLEHDLNSNDSLDTKVEEFIGAIMRASMLYRLDLLVHHLMREQKRTVVSQEIDIVGPGATVVGAKIDRIG